MWYHGVKNANTRCLVIILEFIWTTRRTRSPGNPGPTVRGRRSRARPSILPFADYKYRDAHNNIILLLWLCAPYAFIRARARYSVILLLLYRDTHYRSYHYSILGIPRCYRYTTYYLRLKLREYHRIIAVCDEILIYRRVTRTCIVHVCECVYYVKRDDGPRVTTNRRSGEISITCVYNNIISAADDYCCV